MVKRVLFFSLALTAIFSAAFCDQETLSAAESISRRYLEAPTQKCPTENSAMAVLLPHESDCSSYYACESGAAILLRCPTDLHFNPEESVCDFPDRAGCKLTPITTPVIVESSTEDSQGKTGKPSLFCPRIDGEFPKFFLHLTNCSIYYMCGNGLAYEFVCPDGLHFNLELNVCDYPRNVGCLRESRTFEPSSSKTTLEIRSSSAGFSRAESSSPEVSTTEAITTSEEPSSADPSTAEQSSPEVSTTEAITTTPEESSSADFSTSEPSSTDSSTSEPSSTEETSPNGYSTRPPICEGRSDGMRRPHDVYCNKYYVCQGNGKKVEFSCPEGLHFSPTTKRCEFPADADCTLEYKRRW